MQRIIAGIVLVALFAGGFWYYTQAKAGQNPEKVYERALEIPGFEKAQAYVIDKIKNWEPDPEDPEIRIPKNWGKSEITVSGKTFTVYSPDTEIPPRYYISFVFPKTLIKKVQLVKCWGTTKEKTTDVCIVGNDAKLEAYFQILKLLQAPDFSKFAPNIQMNP